jgi:hypothetical protein
VGLSRASLTGRIVIGRSAAFAEDIAAGAVARSIIRRLLDGAAMSKMPKRLCLRAGGQQPAFYPGRVCGIYAVCLELECIVNQ